MEWGKSKGLWG